MEFFDDTTHSDWGAGVLQPGTSTWVFVPTPHQLQVDVHVIRAVFTGMGSYQSSSGLLSGGETILPRQLTVTAVTSTKIYDGTTAAAAMPAITGSLLQNDTGLFNETYNDKNVGTGKTLTPAGSVNDGNSGNNYTLIFVPIATGVITPRQVTVTASVNTKAFDETTAASSVTTILP